MNGSTNGRPTQTQVTGFPMVTLVDIDGCPVPVGEKDIPDVQPEECDALHWGAWTDVISYHIGASDPDLDRARMRVAIADAVDALVDRIDAAAGDADEDIPPDDDGDDSDPPAFGELSSGLRAILGRAD
jgi:hypothetical protein